MIFDDKQLEEFAKAMTGRSQRGNTALLKHWELKALAAHQAIRDLEEKIKRTRDDREMYYTMWVNAGGSTPDNQDPPKEFDETLFRQPEINYTRPRRLQPGESIKLNWTPEKEDGEDSDEPVSIAKRHHIHKKPRTNITAADFAAFFELIHEEYGVYPPDDFSAQFYVCSKATITRYRNEAYSLGLITADPTDKRSAEWKNAHVSLHGAKDHIGAA